MKKRLLSFRLLILLLLVGVTLLCGCDLLEEDYDDTEYISVVDDTTAYSSDKTEATEKKTTEKVTEESKEESITEDVTIETSEDDTDEEDNYSKKQYYFRNKKLKNQHYEKHGEEMGFSSADEYERAASDVVNNPNALHKLEAEDGDDIYYVEKTNEFVVVSTDGYIRTYFNPSSGKKYYDKQ